jgi:hypothetical protein
MWNRFTRRANTVIEETRLQQRHILTGAAVDASAEDHMIDGTAADVEAIRVRVLALPAGTAIPWSRCRA